jgi:hypothetical protein
VRGWLAGLPSAPVTCWSSTTTATVRRFTPPPASLLWLMVRSISKLRTARRLRSRGAAAAVGLALACTPGWVPAFAGWPAAGAGLAGVAGAAAASVPPCGGWLLSVPGRPLAPPPAPLPDSDSSSWLLRSVARFGSYCSWVRSVTSKSTSALTLARTPPGPTTAASRSSMRRT